MRDSLLSSEWSLHGIVGQKRKYTRVTRWSFGITWVEGLFASMEPCKSNLESSKVHNAVVRSRESSKGRVRFCVYTLGLNDGARTSLLLSASCAASQQISRRWLKLVRNTIVRRYSLYCESHVLSVTIKSCDDAQAHKHSTASIAFLSISRGLERFKFTRNAISHLQF